jgi:ABC-type antimicrobial peptide transport system permease subunit
MRSALSTLGVVIGVAALVAILALGDGLERFSREQVESTTDLHTVTVTVQTDLRVDGLLVRRDSLPRFSAADLESLLGRIPVPVTGFRMLVGSAMSRPPDSTRDVGVLIRAVDAAAATGERIRVLHGDLEAWHERSDRIVAILSRSAAEAFFPSGIEHAPGGSVAIGGRELPVAGVLDGPPTARPLELFVPLNDSTLAWLSGAGRVPSIVLQADRVEDVPSVVRAADAWVAEHYPGVAVRVESSRARVEQVSRGLLVFKLGLASIAAISLLVGGIGIMNILLASVSERTREIGIRKSAGARARDIRMQFLAESVAISGLGSLVGVVVGMGGALVATGLIRQITDAPVHAAFTWQSIVVACAAAILVGLVFGTYPARKASRLSPIDAIRHE